MAKITQQDLESWKSALTPPPVHYLLHISLPFPDLLPWMKSERGLSPSQGTLQLLIELPFLERHIPTTLWLFCVFPSACGTDPDCLNGVMSPPGAAQRPLGCWGWDAWRLPEAGHSLQLVLMEMGCARRADRGMESAPATSAHTWEQVLECPEHCRRWMPASDLRTRGS